MTSRDFALRSLCVLVAATSASLLFAVPGCSFFDWADDCERSATCPGAVGNDGGPDGGDSGPSPSCIPSMNSSPVADSCGVFVSSTTGDDTNGKGTQKAPYKTITKGLAQGTTVYACAGTTPYSEAVVVGTPVTLFGALDCGTWAYVAANKTQLTAPADAVPLKLASTASGTAVNDFAITAADATMAGGSSIAVLDDQAELTLEKVDVVAGKGAGGAAGAPQAQVMTPTTANGTNGGDDAMCNNMLNIPGGPGGTNTCNGMPTNGGNGGKGLPGSTGDNGGAGQPVVGPGNGGTGQTGTTQCQPGQQGTQGGLGSAGTGAHGIGLVSPSGYQPIAAAPGGAGTPGQGGGGGGAALACDAPTDTFSGPSGGGGGAGGCGGAPGNPGTSAGSSIGILALGAKLTLTNVTVTAKGGGAGGTGGDGQHGGNGGQPGSAGGSGACVGGPGGQGGAGGPGGGGAGGHSVGIATNGGTLPDLKSATITHGSGGGGGGGGNMNTQIKGDDGLGCKTLDFANPANPMACVM